MYMYTYVYIMYITKFSDTTSSDIGKEFQIFKILSRCGRADSEWSYRQIRDSSLSNLL